MRQGSQELFARSLKVIPGGVNSPVRAFRGVGGTPVFIARGHGATITDVDGNDYIDYVGSWGPLILGHASPVVVAAVQETAAAGLSFGAPTQREAELAELICRLMPSIEQVRLVNSGTEATMSAVRLARAATGRDLILKFEGCYHGHVDSLLVAAGSGLLTLGAPDSPGVPRAVAELTHVLPYNDLLAVEDLFAAVGNQIAAVIVEPVAGNMGCIPPLPEFLPGLRSVCDRFGALLIFDEVMTGFRVVLGGAQALYGAKPDLTTLGKVIGGGLPVGAFGGRTDLMNQMAPSGAVYQAGTLSGNPLATAAGLATLREVSQPGFFESLRERTQALCQGLTDAARGQGIELQTRSVGAMFGLFFTGRTVLNCLADVRRCDTERYARFFHAMLKEGVYLAPSAFESGFVSVAHSQAVIDATLAAAGKAFQSLG